MEKIKQFTQSDKGKDILTVLIVILVALGSFGLGRMSKTSTEANSGINVEYTAPVYNQPASAIAPVNNKENNKSSKMTKNPKNTSGAYFASNRGSKYYSIGCTGGKTIKQENRIYFKSKEEAEKAGYEISSSCK